MISKLFRELGLKCPEYTWNLLCCRVQTSTNVSIGESNPTFFKHLVSLVATSNKARQVQSTSIDDESLIRRAPLGRVDVSQTAQRVKSSILPSPDWCSSGRLVPSATIVLHVESFSKVYFAAMILGRNITQD